MLNIDSSSFDSIQTVATLCEERPPTPGGTVWLDARQSPPGKLAAHMPLNIFPVRYTNKTKKRIVDHLKRGEKEELAKFQAVVDNWPTSVAVAMAQQVGRWRTPKSALQNFHMDKDERDGVPNELIELQGTVFLLISERVKRNLPIDHAADGRETWPVLCTSSFACFLEHDQYTGSSSNTLPSPCEEITVSLSPPHGHGSYKPPLHPIIWPPPVSTVCMAATHRSMMRFASAAGLGSR
jgi:hypothetical protein